jgi:hypothetical protein
MSINYTLLPRIVHFPLNIIANNIPASTLEYFSTYMNETLIVIADRPFHPLCSTDVGAKKGHHIADSESTLACATIEQTLASKDSLSDKTFSLSFASPSLETLGEKLKSPFRRLQSSWRASKTESQHSDIGWYTSKHKERNNQKVNGVTKSANIKCAVSVSRSDIVDDEVTFSGESIPTCADSDEKRTCHSDSDTNLPNALDSNHNSRKDRPSADSMMAHEGDVQAAIRLGLLALGEAFRIPGLEFESITFDKPSNDITYIEAFW